MSTPYRCPDPPPTSAPIYVNAEKVLARAKARQNQLARPMSFALALAILPLCLVPVAEPHELLRWEGVEFPPLVIALVSLTSLVGFGLFWFFAFRGGSPLERPMPTLEDYENVERLFSEAASREEKPEK